MKEEEDSDFLPQLNPWSCSSYKKHPPQLLGQVHFIFYLARLYSGVAMHIHTTHTHIHIYMAKNRLSCPLAKKLYIIILLTSTLFAQIAIISPIGSIVHKKVHSHLKITIELSWQSYSFT